MKRSSPLAGKSVVISGERGDGTPFQVTLNKDEEFELKNENTGFELSFSKRDRTSLIAFDLDQCLTMSTLMLSDIENQPGSRWPIYHLNRRRPQSNIIGADH